MRHGIKTAAVLVVVAAASCAAPPARRQACTPGTPPRGAPRGFTRAGGNVDGAPVSAIVSCADTHQTSYVAIDLGDAPRRLRFLSGAVRCSDGVFRNVDAHHPECDRKGLPAAPEASVLADSFFRDVGAAWAAAGIEVAGIGLLTCKSSEPMIALADFAMADAAAALLVARARVWQLGGPVYLAVRGRGGICLE